LRERAESVAALEAKLRQHAEIGAKYTEAGMLMSQNKYQEAENVMNAIPVHLPSASAIFTVLGLVHAQRGEWPAAITNYSKVVELLPDDHFAYYVLAPLLLQVGDVDGYRNHRERILRQFGGTSDPRIGERMTKACLLLPPSPADLQTVQKMADVAVAAGTDQPDWVYYQFAKGLAEYRSGHFDEASRWLTQVIDHEGYYDRAVQACAVLAMAQYQLKQPEQARATLANGIKIADTNLPKPASHYFGQTWHDWIIDQVLMREAQSLIERPKPPIPD
jgi:tetratricopeptide (TPR) repeat protein